MSSLFHRRPTMQGQDDRPNVQQHAAYPAYQPRPQATVTPSLGSAVDLRQQGKEAARRLKVLYRHLLIEIASTTLDGSYEPYEPASEEAAHLAATLAHPSIGLLVAGSAGFVTCYSLTPLGGAVVSAMLHELLTQQTQHVQRVQQAMPGPAPTPRSGGPYGQW